MSLWNAIFLGSVQLLHSICGIFSVPIKLYKWLALVWKRRILSRCFRIWILPVLHINIMFHAWMLERFSPPAVYTCLPKDKRKLWKTILTFSRSSLEVRPLYVISVRLKDCQPHKQRQKFYFENIYLLNAYTTKRIWQSNWSHKTERVYSHLAVTLV